MRGIYNRNKSARKVWEPLFLEVGQIEVDPVRILAAGERFLRFRPGARGGARGRAQSAPRRAWRFVHVYGDVLEGFRRFPKDFSETTGRLGREAVSVTPRRPCT